MDDFGVVFAVCTIYAVWWTPLIASVGNQHASFAEIAVKTWNMREDIEYTFGWSCRWSSDPSITLFDSGIGFVKIYKPGNQNSTQSSWFLDFWFMKTLNLGWSSFFCRKITAEDVKEEVNGS